MKISAASYPPVGEEPLGLVPRASTAAADPRYRIQEMDQLVKARRDPPFEDPEVKTVDRRVIHVR
ncbi:hypothetical protein GCM10010251_96690 [Streptomyces aurantiogriseus]|uniref:Uncharacterized protein n=1 Tax=Streptomyces aurantiogriseus TaxID=66870 RepID=A0A918L0D7_9ACTN|nr:hypothetical protein GCM10010251_96690 [Streptomyces aurantiogriseus]